MPSDFFSKNMDILKQVYPLLAKEISTGEEFSKTASEISEEDLRIEAASTGLPTLFFRGHYIHSKRDPEREAERLVESAADGETPVVILGFGLGYSASALKFSKRPVIVVEKYPCIFKKALEERDLSSLLSREQLVFVLGGTGEGVTDALSLFESSAGVFPPVLQNRALTDLDGEWYSAVEEKIKNWNSRTTINQATQKRFGKRWVRNLSKNLETIRDIPGISRLEGLILGKNIPAFLAAAGPGLDKAGPLLEEISKRCITVAVDTSLRFLVNRGVEPDFVLSVDPQFWNFRHLDMVPAPNTRLVAESAVYPPVLRHSFGGIFLCGSFFPLGRFIEEKVDPKGNLGAGGSVATSAWDFIRLLGAKEVWIAGLDLSFPDLKTHFKGALFEERSQAESGRFNPVETWNFQALRSGQPFLAKKAGGGSVLTDKRLSLYASWFENRFSQFPDHKNFTLSGEGLEIKKLETSSPEALLALPDCRDEIDSLLNGLYSGIDTAFSSEEEKKIRGKNYENAKNSLLIGLREIKNLSEDAAECAENAVNKSRQGRLDDKEREKVLKRLDSASEAIKNSAVKEIAGFLFPETADWEAEIARKNPTPLDSHLQFSARFYRVLAEAAQYNLFTLS